MKWKDQEVEVIYSKRKKTVSIMIERDGSISVLVPETVQESMVVDLLNAKEYSIVKNQMMWQFANEERENRSFVNGQSFMLKGQNYTLSIRDDADSKSIVFDGQHFLLGKGAQDPRMLMETFYKAECKKYLQERLSVYGPQVGMLPHKIGVRTMPTRWASCTPKGNIYMSWNCVMAPQFVFDYLLVHELTHLKNHRHDRQFWQMVSLVLPNYESAVDWLQRNGVKMIL